MGALLQFDRLRNRYIHQRAHEEEETGRFAEKGMSHDAMSSEDLLMTAASTMVMDGATREGPRNIPDQTTNEMLKLWSFFLP